MKKKVVEKDSNFGQKIKKEKGEAMFKNLEPELNIESYEAKPRIRYDFQDHRPHPKIPRTLSHGD